MFIARRAVRPRHGRLLIEALVALVVAAAAGSALAGIGNSALAMSDAAQQFDIAARSLEQSGADALRAPCRLQGGQQRFAWSARHVTDRVAMPGVVAQLRHVESWHTIGVGRHDSMAIIAQIGVRCD